MSLKSFALQKFSNSFILVHIIGANLNSKGMQNTNSLFFYYAMITYLVEKCNKRDLTSPEGGITIIKWYSRLIILGVEFPICL